jgi:hypothetical protein
MRTRLLGILENQEIRSVPRHELSGFRECNAVLVAARLFGAPVDRPVAAFKDDKAEAA